MSKSTTDLEAATNVITDDDLAAITSFHDLKSLFAAKGIVAERIEDYGTGFKVVEDKDKLIGVPFIVIEWRYRESDDYLNDDGQPATYSVVELVTDRNEKLVLVDGGSGITAQLQTIEAQRIAAGSVTPTKGLIVEGGLRRSDYTTEKDGKPVKGTTYYLSA